METVEEKNQNIQRKRARRTSSSLPLDLVSNILLRLPAKSVVRFRCVSKLWSSVTTDPYFIKSFETRSSTRPSLLAFYKKADTMYVSSLPDNHQNSSSEPTDHYHMKHITNSCVSPTESVHGLICFTDSAKPIIWNPTMRKFLTSLPKPEASWKNITCFLGYDPILGQHKVICIPTNQISDECRVLTLGSNHESWRKIKTGYKNASLEDCYGRCINGIVYYKSYKLVNGLCVEVIMSFDVKSEKFDEIASPPMHDSLFMLTPCEGKFGCVGSDSYEARGGITLCKLEDAEKHIWTRRHFHAQFDYFDEDIHCMYVGITHAGEMVYASYQMLDSFCVVYFDMKKKSFRRVEFVDEEFRLSNGFGSRYREVLHFATNHIESLVSL